MLFNYQGKCLLIPSKPDIERDTVAKAWEEHGGVVMRVEKFWETVQLDGRQAVLYGNHIFCLVLAQKLNLELISPPDDFMLHLSEKWLKRKIVKSTITDALNLAYPVFIKPLVPKTFSGKVYGSYKELLEECRQLEGETPIIYSEIIRIQAEARTFILDNKIVSASVYEGDLDIKEAIFFIDQFLAENTDQVPRTYVIDVGLLDSGEWAIIETNAVWGAGLNGCDADAILCCIAEATKALPDLS